MLPTSSVAFAVKGFLLPSEKSSPAQGAGGALQSRIGGNVGNHSYVNTLCVNDEFKYDQSIEISF
jgi:hypothetical protein